MRRPYLERSDGRVSFHPVTFMRPNGKWAAVCIEQWASLNASTHGQVDRDTKAEARVAAWGLCLKAQAHRNAELDADRGELVEVLANGFELRRKPFMGGFQYNAMDPACRTAGPYRGSVHDAWTNRKGEKRWRMDAGGKSRTDIKTEKGAVAALKRVVLETYPA